MVFLGELQLQLQHFLLPNHGKIPHGSFAKIRPRVGRQGRAAAGQHRHHQRAGSRRYDLTSSLSLKTVSDMLRWGLRLVVYPIIYRVWDTSTRWLFGISEPSTISFRKGCKNHFVPIFGESGFYRTKSEANMFTDLNHFYVSFYVT